MLGGGGLGYFFSWRYNRRKEKAEVEQAETTAAKEMQDMYQQLIEDVKRDRDEQKAYIVELKEDRQAGAKSIDAFNIISFDTTRKVIKIVRIGSDTDSLMRHKGVLSIQYGGETPEVIFNN